MNRACIGVMVAVGMCGLAASVEGAAVVRSAGGANAAAIQATVDQFRVDVSLGGANNGNGGAFTVGRREINWDGGANSNVTTALAADGFNGNPVARGAQYSTPGAGFIQSARIPGDDANAALRFGDLNAVYNTAFKVFSNQKLIAPSGSTQMDVRFFLPSSATTPATVFGFGAVFTDVDLAGQTRIQYFNTSDQLLGEFNAPVADGGLSFLGVSFDAGERVSRVRILSGNTPLGAGAVDSVSNDVVAIDDFMYSEPVPAPGAGVLAVVAGLVGMRRKRGLKSVLSVGS